MLLFAALLLLLTISIIDLRTQTIPDVCSVALLITALLYNKATSTFDLSGAVLGVGFFGVLWLLGRGKWIGDGDILLGAGIGTLLGSWKLMAACLLVTYSIGSLATVALLISHYKQRGDRIAFVPFLTIGTVTTMLFQDRLDLLIRF